MSDLRLAEWKVKPAPHSEYHGQYTEIGPPHLDLNDEVYCHVLVAGTEPEDVALAQRIVDLLQRHGPAWAVPNPDPDAGGQR